MNEFGRMFRVSIFGESHGPQVGVVIDGCPAGITLTAEDMASDLNRRKGGTKGTTARVEVDAPVFASGLFKGRTTGAPILISFANADVDSSPYEKLKDTPRPGHADFAAQTKFGGYSNYLGGGHFSGRLTVGLVAAGCIAKKIISSIDIKAHLISAGGSKDAEKAAKRAAKEGNSIGGLIECRCTDVPAGLGEPFFDAVESLISHIAFAIPGIKGIEFGAGFASADMKGSAFNDPIVDKRGRTKTNNAGGISGGITNGNEIVFRVAVRPTASIKAKQYTVDLKTGKGTTITVSGRHDACIALRAPVVLEAATAIVLCDLMMLEGRIKRVKEG